MGRSAPQGTGSARAEAALRQSEALFRTVFENVNDEIYIGALDGRFLEVNGVACRNLGYTREELLRMSVKDIDCSPSSNSTLRRNCCWRRGGRFSRPCTCAKDGVQPQVEISARGFE